MQNKSTTTKIANNTKEEVSPKEEITFLNDESLKKFCVKEIKRHHKAYEELGK